MKIIDEKGKVFGIINIVDLFVLMFLLIIFPIFYFTTKTLTSRKAIEKVAEIPKVYKEIQINARAVKLEPEVINKISVGDKEFNPQGEPIAQIIAVGEPSSYEMLSEVFDLGLGNSLIEKNVSLKQLSGVQPSLFRATA